MEKEVKQDILAPTNDEKSPVPPPKQVNKAPWISMRNGGSYTKNYDEKSDFKQKFDKDMNLVKNMQKNSSSLYDDKSYMNSIKN